MIVSNVKNISLETTATPFNISTPGNVKEVTGKAWTYFNIYNLIKLRDVYNLIKKTGQKDKKELYRVISAKVFKDSKYDDRSILEYDNALKKLNLLSENYQIIKDVFSDTSIDEKLTDKDIQDLRGIFFSYGRFQEFLNWYRKEDVHNDFDKSVLIHTNMKGKYIDTFYYNFDFSSCYQIPEKFGDTQRFWDVFLKWGTALGVLEKISLNQLSEYSKIRKSLVCTYLIEELPNFSIIDFIRSNYSSKHLYLPHLILDMACSTRASVSVLIEKFFEEYEANKSIFSLERTSEVFITKKKIKEETTMLFPKYKGAYISHISIR